MGYRSPLYSDIRGLRGNRRYRLAPMTIDEIIADFALLEDWDDRYRYVIELGRALAPA